MGHMSDEQLALDPPGRSVMPSRSDRSGAYDDAVRRLLTSFQAVPATETVRLAKKTSNLFRQRERTRTPGLDVSALTGVLDIDRTAMTADVAGMCTYEDLVSATLAVGLSPLVVPQLKTITVGGALTGLGIESTSFRSGLVHESVLEFDVLTGTGAIVTATPKGDHSDLFFGFPNSYGSLGYATRVRIQLEPVKQFVSLRHLRFSSLLELQNAIDDISKTGTHDGERVDYLDGVVFNARESYLTLGAQTDRPGPIERLHRTADLLPLDPAANHRSVDHRRLSVAVGPGLVLVFPSLWRAAPAGASIVAETATAQFFLLEIGGLDRRFGLADRIERLHGRPPMERVVQDIEVPVDGTADFLTWFLDNVPIEPIWLCPLRARAEAGAPPRTWPLYTLDPERTYVNVGFWSAVPTDPGAVEGATNRKIEDRVTAAHGRKSLYSDSFYAPEVFADLYGGEQYHILKNRYDPDRRLLGMYEKTVERR